MSHLEPEVGIEPTTYRLQGGCSTTELHRPDTVWSSQAGRNAFGVATVDVDIAFTAGTICCHRGMAATPIISLRW